ncbi:MAG: formylglycine-generating enzyme family protein [Planctomycetaceae bacterium]|jgi:formylglycine-generating enzyme required for sulfatase activity|nr:formylglycine-generating enzyme family protein [Planctomycetaceae bacterium]
MKRISDNNGLLKMLAWGVLFLTVTLIVWRREVFWFFDDFFDASISLVIEDRLNEPLVNRREMRRQHGDSLFSEEREMVGSSSEAARASLLRDPVHPKPVAATPSSLVAIPNPFAAIPNPLAATPQGRYANRYDYVVSPGEPEMMTHAAALNRKEIPSLDTLVDSDSNPPEPEPELPQIRERSKLDEMAPSVLLSGGSFRMGDDAASERDQKPSHLVRLEPFRLDCYEVTNRQFQLFVRETKYRTTAERRGWSFVFDFERKVWIRMVGVCWWNPSGKNPHGGAESAVVTAMYDYPVVHVTWDDAQAFCYWSGKRLPSEAEWEYAAKGGQVDALYPWGNQRQINGVFMANYWQGWYPNENSAADGFLLSSPIASFPPNGYGLYDLGGNVWEWCGDRYRTDYYRRSPLDNPLGPSPEEGEIVTIPLFRIRRENGRYVEEEPEGTFDISLRVLRGGSFLSAENSDAGYRTTTRNQQPQSFSFQDVGFRCAESVTK